MEHQVAKQVSVSPGVEDQRGWLEHLLRLEPPFAAIMGADGASLQTEFGEGDAVIVSRFCDDGDVELKAPKRPFGIRVPIVALTFAPLQLGVNKTVRQLTTLTTGLLRLSMFSVKTKRRGQRQTLTGAECKPGRQSIVSMMSQVPHFRVFPRPLVHKCVSALASQTSHAAPEPPKPPSSSPPPSPQFPSPAANPNHSAARTSPPSRAPRPRRA